MELSKKFINILVVTIVVSIFAIGCGSSNDDLGDGFKSKETTTTKTTVPSKTPRKDQPCSLLSTENAAAILGTTVEKLGKPESSEPDKDILRCRYGAISDDNKLYLVLNIYIYKTQSSFSLIKKLNKATNIETNIDEGFYYDKTTTKQSERYVAARKGSIRIAVSSSIATIDPKVDLAKDQIQLPDINSLANTLGNVIAKLE
ncbi:MAG: hypothetical protein U0R17_03345 [Acidimicrobiia bacterium]